MGLQWSSTFVRSKPSLAASSAARCSDEAEDLSFPRGSMSSLRVHILHNMLFEFLTMGRTYSYWNRPDFLLVVFLWQQHYDDEEEKTYFMRNKVQCQQWQWRLWQRQWQWQWRLWQWQGNGNDAYAYDNDNGDDNDDGDLDCLLVSFPPSPSLLPPPFPPVPLFSRSPFYHIHHLFIIFITFLSYSSAQKLRFWARPMHRQDMLLGQRDMPLLWYMIYDISSIFIVSSTTTPPCSSIIFENYHHQEFNQDEHTKLLPQFMRLLNGPVSVQQGCVDLSPQQLPEIGVNCIQH